VRAIALAVVTIACAPRAAEPLAPVIAHKERQLELPAPHSLQVPRPDVVLDVNAFVPDLHDELRWPLTVAMHPVLAPQFPIARELAQPGVEWTSLCSGPVLARHVIGTNANDLMEYLRGWCAALAHDPDGALGHFAHVRGSVVAGLAAALVYDIAFVLADETADVAERLLQKHNLPDLAILDTLAATYIEIGRDDDARQINRRAIAFAGHTTTAAYCRRYARDILLGGDLAQLRPLLGTTKVDACTELIEKLDCTVAHDCFAFVTKHGGTSAEARIVDAVLSWPTDARNYDVWNGFALRLRLALPLNDANQLGSAAVRAMARTTDCGNETIDEIRALADSFSTPELRGFDFRTCIELKRAERSAQRP
jgi:hypothetical protein